MVRNLFRHPRIKLYQQTLEQQIKERTEELADANTRLQHEMWERDLARKTLDEQNEKMMTALKERTQGATLLAEMGELPQSCLTREEVFTAALGLLPGSFPIVAVRSSYSIPHEILSKSPAAGMIASSRRTRLRPNPSGPCAPGILISFPLEIPPPAVVTPLP